MAFNPKDFIDISFELNDGASEAHYRSSISRAYYGCFGVLKKDLKIYVTDASVHQELIKTLKNSLSSNKQIVGKRLETLFKKRKEADYSYHLEIKKHNCTFYSKEANDIIELYYTNDEDIDENEDE